MASIGKNNIVDGLESLLNSNTESHVIADVGFTDEDYNLINKINIIQKIYSIYGYILEEKELKSISNFIQMLGNDKEISNSVAKIIVEKFIRPSMLASKHTSAWFTIRCTQPTDYYDEARWHCDGLYFIPAEPLVMYKIVCTMRGAGTIIKTDPIAKKIMYRKESEMVAKINKRLTNVDRTDTKKVQKITNDIRRKYRTVVADSLNLFETIQLDNNQAVIFIAGDKDRCLIHSEPPIHAKRIFISIVPGKYSDIVSMAEFREEPVDKPIYN